MQDHDIFAALAKVRKGAVALAGATRTLVPQLEEDLRRLEACCAGDGAGQRIHRHALHHDAAIMGLWGRFCDLRRGLAVGQGSRCRTVRKDLCGFADLRRQAGTIATRRRRKRSCPRGPWPAMADSPG